MKAKVEDLKRYFGKTRAVDGITFEFVSGQVVGFVGPNGAGKTTTMRIMATIDMPTDGDIIIDGVSVVQNPEKIRKMVGFMPDFLPMHSDMTVDDYLDFFARAFDIRSNQRPKVVQSVEEFTGLTGIREKFLKALSKGMRQRVSLARALVHDPPVLILDEPAAGLDPRARIELRELLRALADQKKAILISSHILSELSEICDSTVIIEKGKLLRAGTIDSLNSERSMRTMLLRTTGDGDKLARSLMEKPRVIAVRKTGAGVEVDLRGTDNDCGELVSAIIAEGHTIIEIKQLKVGLEDIFMDITKGELA